MAVDAATIVLPPAATVSVRTHVKDYGGMSTAALVDCDDGNQYVIKRASLGRPLVAEHVVARLGKLIGAPCMDVCFAHVPPDLIAADPRLNRFAGGIAHASRYIDGLNEVRGVTHFQYPENRDRLARVYALFSWALAEDHQFMHEPKPPHLIYSHDHGRFFAGCESWTPASLTANPGTVLDAKFEPAAFTAAEMAPVIQALGIVSNDQIAAIVGAVPNDWGVPADHLNALTQYLCPRREQLLQLLNNL